MMRNQNVSLKFSMEIFFSKSLHFISEILDKMCVSHTILDACNELVANRSSELAKIICVPARDRIQCLEKVNKREADFVAVDPEDMYIAFQMKNEDFSVFSEIRTVEEPDGEFNDYLFSQSKQFFSLNFYYHCLAEFRYEGIILVRKNSDIHSLNDLQGKKSCHTGYGRNVGYKIPITKLKKHGVLKISASPSLSPLEKELKGLSDLFTESCLVGTYSPRDEVNRALSKQHKPVLISILFYILIRTFFSLFSFQLFVVVCIKYRKTIC